MNEIDPARLDALIDGAPSAGDSETTMCALLDEVRALEAGAPADLRARILEHAAERPGREPRGQWVRTWLQPPRLAFAGTVAVAVVAAAVVIPNLGDDPIRSADGSNTVQEAVPSAAGASEAAPTREKASGADLSSAAPSATAPVPSDAQTRLGARPGRIQEVRAATRVQVADVKALSEASNAAMREVRRQGGYTVSSRYSVPNGGRGDNSLVFRVPVANAEAAITAFGGLGTVLSQQAEMRDLTRAVNAEAAKVRALEARAKALTERLAATPGDPELRAQLAAIEAQLRGSESRGDGLKRRGEFARLSLELTTEGPPAAVEPEGEIEGSLRRSGQRLASVSAWTLGTGVLLAPFALVGGAGLVGVRAVRRRQRQRERDLI